MNTKYVMSKEGFGVEVGLPGTDTWQRIQEIEADLWSSEFDLSPDDYRAIYPPYDSQSVLLHLLDDQETAGAGRLLLPRPGTMTLRDNAVNFLTLHAALAETDETGTPVWGKLDISAEGWRKLEEIDGRLCVDSLTHIIKKPYRGSNARYTLESLAFGLATGASTQLVDYFVAAEENLDTKLRGGSTVDNYVITCLVRPYRTLLEREFTAYGSDGKKVHQGITRLGPESPYGARRRSEWVTPVLVSVNEVVRADELRHPDNPHVDISLFANACEEFYDFIRDYMGVSRW